MAKRSKKAFQPTIKGKKRRRVITKRVTNGFFSDSALKSTIIPAQRTAAGERERIIVWKKNNQHA